MLKTIDTLKNLTEHLRYSHAKNIKVKNKHDDNEYFLAFQFYVNSRRLCYLAFINKENNEIDYFSDDIDNCEFKDILNYWTMELV